MALQPVPRRMEESAEEIKISIKIKLKDKNKGEKKTTKIRINAR